MRRGIARPVASMDYEDGDATGWATYIALDHRLDDRRAAEIHEAFEQWLRQGGMPPSGSGPISSASLFGPQLAGGYLFLRLSVSQSAGETAEHEWMLITEPRYCDDGDAGDVIVTPVPPRKRLAKIRAKLRRRDERSGA